MLHYRATLLVLTHLRCGDTFAQLAASFQISTVTAYRYVTEAVKVLAAAAPSLQQALQSRAGEQVTVLDGTIIPASGASTARARPLPRSSR